MPRPGRRWWSRWRILLVIVAALLLGGGVAAWLLLREPGNISHPDLPGFTVTPPPARPVKPALRFAWPNYGYDAARTLYLPASAKLRPPFERGWTWHGNVLLEFPPALDGLSLYQLKNNGALYALSRRTGRIRWRRKLGELAASSPATGKGRVYVTLLRANTGRNGRVVALDERDGSIVWSRSLPSRSESSPVERGGVLYFGSENGTVYALRARDGKPKWTFHAAGAIKGAPALSGGKLYFGTYGGHVYAIRTSNGHKVWAVGTSGAKFGFGSGNFYATAAVAFGRVFIGNTDGRVYAFSTANGKLAWAHQTGNYVYSSAVAANIVGLGPTIYVGSYSGKFYALDARSGRVRWTHKAGGRISGSPTLIGDVVYYSYLAPRSKGGNGGTGGLLARNGKRVFGFARGAFNPAVSDGRNLYLVGYSGIYQLIPTNGPPAASPTRPEAIRARERAARRARHRAAVRRRAKQRAAHRRAQRRAKHHR